MAVLETIQRASDYSNAYVKQDHILVFNAMQGNQLVHKAKFPDGSVQVFRASPLDATPSIQITASMLQGPSSNPYIVVSKPNLAPLGFKIPHYTSNVLDKYQYVPIVTYSSQIDVSDSDTVIQLNPYIPFQGVAGFQGPWTLYFASGAQTYTKQQADARYAKRQPVGSIILVAQTASSADSIANLTGIGYFSCSGQAMSKTAYPALFEAIGRSFSQPTLDQNYFRLPNIQHPFAGSSAAGVGTNIWAYIYTGVP